jgi:hypothetical protein
MPFGLSVSHFNLEPKLVLVLALDILVRSRSVTGGHFILVHQVALVAVQVFFSRSRKAIENLESTRLVVNLETRSQSSLEPQKL